MRAVLVSLVMWLGVQSALAGDNGTSYSCESADKTVTMHIYENEIYADEDQPTGRYTSIIDLKTPAHGTEMPYASNTQVFSTNPKTSVTTVRDRKNGKMLLAFKEFSSASTAFDKGIDVLQSEYLTAPLNLKCIATYLN